MYWHKHFEKNVDSFAKLLRELTDENKKIMYISSVRKDITRRVMEAAPGMNFQILSTSGVPTQLINYSTVDTLGIDRFLVCYGAFHISKGNAVIVIDTGSACTVDFMDETGVYQGGVIMPGLEILNQSVRRYLPELPGVDTNIPGSWPGKSTKDSLRWGINGMFSLAIERWISKFKALNEDAVIFITGGNAGTVQQLPGVPDCIHDANLLFEGMKIMVEKSAG